MRVFQEAARDRVVFEARATDALRDELDRRGSKRVLALVSATLGRHGAPGDVALAELGGRIVARFDGLSEHTPLDRVIEAAQLARTHEADTLVAIGGGSVIDGAKAVKAAVLANMRTPEDFSRWARDPAGLNAIARGGPPLIAVPTTISAAEYTAFAGYTNPSNNLKEGVGADSLMPASVILDPDLCVHTPIDLWTSTGIRSVDHAVEAIFSPASWPALSAQAAAGLRMLADGLRASATRPADSSARSMCQQGVWLLAAVCGRIQMGASHGLGYLLGTLGGVPHGKTSCVLLPSVVAWNTPACPESAALVARTLDASDAARGVRDLIAGLGLPTRIGELGVRKEVLDKIADRALNHRVVKANPRPFASRDEVRAFLESAW